MQNLQNKSTQIWLTDKLFPPLLKEIFNPPKKLFCLGQPLDPSDKYFAIVGTRRPSPYGREMAERFSDAISRAGFVIVSGLAYGIDAIAHEAAINAGQKTIAVLGSGLNHITPICNHSLAEQIKKNGTIITEFPHDIAPNKSTFPQRNRIIAGMSLSTLVIEAPERSGALITARFALEYNRDVFAVPGNITQETSKGTNSLIRDCKAFPATCVEDIFTFNNPAIQAALPLLDKNEEKIYEALKISPLSIDQLAIETSLPVFRVTTLISMMEIKTLVKIDGSVVKLAR